MADMSWLEEVKADAEFNYKKRLRDAEELKEHEASKAKVKKPAAPKKDS